MSEPNLTCGRRNGSSTFRAASLARIDGCERLQVGDHRVSRVVRRARHIFLASCAGRVNASI